MVVIVHIHAMRSRGERKERRDVLELKSASALSVFSAAYPPTGAHHPRSAVRGKNRTSLPREDRAKSQDAKTPRIPKN
jgi:hypothetical protein